MIQFLQKKIVYRTEGIPYLVRWNILGFGKDSSLFSIKIHKILVSDDECMHDHPWAFTSIILKGGYREHRYATIEEIFDDHCEFSPKMNQYTTSEYFKPGSILRREANYTHRLELNPDTPCWTLVFTFRKVRKWGFVTKDGWKHWKSYSKKEDC